MDRITERLSMVGERVKQKRTELGLTQVTITKKTGIATSIISAIELGIRLPTVEQALRLSKLFDVTVDWLLGGD